eukprot:10216851-Heterocapsa_arctica.AAC.1
MGHEVQTCGDYEYCLGCGRTTKAKHSTSANIVFCRRQYCKPVMRMERYRKRKHDIVLMNGGHVRTVTQKDLSSIRGT